MSVPIVIAGHSHVRCFGVPHSPDAESRLLELRSGVFGFQAPWPRGREFVSMVADVAKGAHLILCWTGGQLTRQHLFAPTPLFDLHSSVYPDLPIVSGATLVPESMAEASLVAYERLLTFAIQRLRKTAAAVTVISPPPPRADDTKAIERILADESLARRFDRIKVDAETFRVTPATIRLKLWGLQDRMTKRQAEAQEVNYAAAPAETLDDAGFLKETYAAGDFTHANNEYGKLFLDRILSGEGRTS